MNDEIHFEGDPAVDSRRRHLERVLKGEPPRRRWPWIAAVVTGGAAWGIWRVLQRPRPDSQSRAARAAASNPE